jgi:CshA-type fibril repeat protein
MKKIILLFVFLIISVTSIAQVITPFTVRKAITQKGGILYLSNTSSKAVPDNAVQNEMPPSGTGYDNNFTNGYVDIDGDSSTFMSSSDKISIPSGDPSTYSLCSEISWAGLYWGGAINSANTNYAVRNQVKMKINTGSYVTLNADYLKDNAIGFKTYHCFKDITSYVNPKGLSDTFTVANVVNDIGAKNLFGGWTIVIIYKDNTTTMKNLTVFDGLANVSSGTYSTVDIPISGFQTPLSGPVNFQLGLVVYDGDRSLTGDQLMFKGASSFVNISDAIHPSSDMFNSTLSRNGMLTSQRNPNYNNTLGYDANIFNPDNSSKNYIGNNAISATIRQTTGGETFLTQVVTSAIDVYEPDLRSAVTVENITHPAAELASPGDILEYTVSGLNIGSDPAVNTYITDKIEGNAFYVPNSISIIEGPNAGAMTDAAGDDQAEYIAATRTVKVRIGTGANSFQGGSILNSPTGIDHTLIKFRVQISSDCVYMYCDNVVDNSAHIQGTGNISGNIFDNASNPGVFDSNGCAISGTTTTPVNITGCSAPTVTVNSPICLGGDINLSATSSPSATYSWTGPNGFTSTSSSPTITNVTAANAGTYTANIYVTGTSCHFVYPIVVDVNVANAGQDLTGATTCGLTTITLAGNNPIGSTGEWTIISGSGGSFGAGSTSTSSIANDTFSGTAGNTYVLRWTLTPLGCDPTFDDVTITFNIPPSLAVLSGSSVTCNNNLSVTITGGTSPYTLSINNGVGSINNYNSGTLISVNPLSTTTYTLSSVIDSNGCSAVSISPNTYQLVITNSMGTGTITANNGPVITSTITSDVAATTGSSSSATTNVWTNPGNIAASDNTYATQTNASTGTTTYLYAKGFGFNIPANAIVDGIVVTVEKKASGTNAIADSRISLLNNTTNLGSNKTITGNWSTTDAVSTYGTSTDPWGTTSATLTPAIVNSANFGFRYRVNFVTANATAYVDYATMKLYYHVGTSSYCDTDSGKTFTVSGFSNATSYTWTPPSGASITSGQGTATATVDFNGAGQSGNYTISVTPLSTCGSGTPATLILPITDCVNSSLAIKGTVYKDVNGSVAPQKVDGTGVGVANGTQLYVTLVKTNGTAAFVQTQPVGSDGTFTFSTGIVQTNTYSVTLSTTNYASGTNPTAALPSGCTNNGEIKNNIANSLTGNDGTIDGKITAITFAANNNITNINFGIKIPTAPVANNDVAITNEDIPVTLNVINNDTDVDGTVSAATVDLNTTTAGIQNTASNSSGSWSVNGSGIVTYTPTANYNGTATLNYKVNDNDSLTSNAATISITVTPVNDPPVASASSVTATENSNYVFSGSNFNYTDLESDSSVSITIASLPSLGTLTYNGDVVYLGQTISVANLSNLLFTPLQNEYGTAYTNFTFKVNDASLGTVMGTMTINVNHVAGPPIAVNNTASTDQDTAVSFNILTNDINSDGTIVTDSVDLDSFTTGQQTTYTTGEGVYSVASDGVLTFTPTTGYYGTTTPMTYTVMNSVSSSVSNEATIIITVIPTGAPIAVNDTTATTSINTPIIFNVTTNDVANDPRIINASRVDLDPATPGIQQSYYVANKGQFYVDMNGDVTFVPDWNFSGTTSITYTVKDSQNLVSNIATITVNTTWANTAPFAIDDFAITNEDTAITFNITSNDYDLDTIYGNSGVINNASIDLDPYTLGIQTSFTVENQGTFTVNSSGNVTFTPVLNFNGAVTPIEYVVDDSDDTTPLTSNSGFIYVTVESVNDAPVVVNDAYTATIAANGSAIFSITSNDSDVDGTLDLTSVDLDPYTAGIQYTYSVVGQGIYTIDVSGNITFSYTGLTPIGVLTPIYYVIKDNDGALSSIGSITITMLAGLPTAVDDTISTNEDVSLSYDVTNNDTDINGVNIGVDPSTVTLIGTLTSSAGTWSITDAVNNPGEVTFTPAANYFGTATINYTVEDLDGNVSNQATITITVNSVNDAPSFAKGANQSVCKNDAAQSISGWATAISAGPSNESTQNVSFVVSNNLNSLFSVQPAISSTGILTYTLANNQTGTATVTVQIQDDGGTANGGVDISVSQTFTILVSPTAVGGTLAITTGSSTVCSGTNSTTMTLSGNTGTRQWQSSTNNITFNNIVGSVGATYTATNLSATTYYRVFVTSGACTSISDVITITVSPTSVAGSISGGATVCSGTNSTTLTLSGNTGSIQWQSASTLAGIYSNISGATASTYTATDLTSTTYYKAVITSGVCSAATTSAATVTVNPLSVAGSVSGGTSVCSVTNSTTLTLSGNTGSIQWQSSNALAGTYSNISGATSATYLANNLSSTTYYRAVVTSGICSSATTSSATITVNAISVAGSISGSATVCSGTNSTTLTLTGNTGSIQWQSASTLAGIYSDISGATASTYTATDLTSTTYYKAVITSGVCSAATTSAATVTVNPISVAGSVSGGASVCTGTNSTTLTLSGNTGSIQWQSSNALAGTYSDISGATSTTYIVTDLTSTTYYRAVVTSGVCSSATTSSTSVIVSPIAVAGNISGEATITTETNSTTLTLSGYIGNIQWQSSNALAGTYSDISGATSATYTAINLTTTTYYRAVVTSGVCSAVMSLPATITVTNYSSRIVDSLCGTTLSDISSIISCYPVDNAIRYRFKIISQSNGRVWFITSTTNTFSLNQLPIYLYNSSYSVSVSCKINGIRYYKPYGPSCTLTTPYPLTKVKDSQCGTTLPTISTTIFTANTFRGARSYRFEVTNNGNVYTYDSTKNYFKLTNLNVPVLYGSTYSIRVSVKLYEVWFSYGESCLVYTPSAPFTQIQSSQCGITLSTNNTNLLYANYVSIAQMYRFEVSLGTDVYTYDTASSGIRSLRLTNVSGLTLLSGTTYAIRVAIKCSGVWQPYGSSCSVTTAGVPPVINTYLTSVIDSQCGTTLSDPNDIITCYPVDNAISYRFKIVALGDGRIWYVTSTTNTFNLNQLPIYLYDTSYSISVSYKIDGDLGYKPYGTACTLTTPYPLTMLKETQCRTILPSFTTAIYTSNTFRGARSYRFEVTNNGTIYTYDSATNYFKLTNLNIPILYGSTYSIRVAVKLYDVWFSYGESCFVYTPAAPLSQIQSSQCGITLSANNTNVLYANVVSVAEMYRFEVSLNTNIYTYDTPSSSIRSFRLTNVSGLTLVAGTTYAIRVAIKYNGVWQPYGPSCSVTTAGIAPTVVKTMVSIPSIEDRFNVSAYPNPSSDNFSFNLTTSDEEKVGITVYDMTGKLVDKQEVNPSEISELQIGSEYPSGIYNVIVSQSDNFKTIRIIKR